MFYNSYSIGRTHQWNPWFGCHKVSPACQHCFIRHKDEFILHDYNHLPFENLPNGSLILVSLQTDFFLEEADPYRETAWDVVRNNPNYIFIFITKRIERVKQCLPSDWGEGWENVVLNVTIENQTTADSRLPILLSIPCRHYWATSSPMLESIDIRHFLAKEKIEHIECCGEKTSVLSECRPTECAWVEDLLQQCKDYNVRFSFMQAGLKFVWNDQELFERTTCYRSIVGELLKLHNVVPLKFNLPSGEIVV